MKNFEKGKKYYSIPAHRYVWFERIQTKHNGKPCCKYIFRDICDAILEYTAEEADRYIIVK